MTDGPAPYDEIADWYDERVVADAAGVHSAAGELLMSMLPAPPGRVLDAGCGGGIYMPALIACGWDVVGVDISAKQLAIAERRVGGAAELIRGDLRSLPLGDASFDAVFATFVHTDVDDVAGVFRELARVLRLGGAFVYVGAHPCFVHPYAERNGRRLILHPGYRTEAWTRTGPGIGEGVRSRVGAHHRSLPSLVNAVLGAGLSIARVVESAEDPYPLLLGLSATRAEDAAVSPTGSNM